MRESFKLNHTSSKTTAVAGKEPGMHDRP